MSPKKATNPKHQCKAPGCVYNRCFAITDEPKPRKEHSKYCKFHNCKAAKPFVKGALCHHRIENGNFFCAKHQKCIAGNCSRHGEYVDRSLPYICADHQCAEENCREQRSIDSTFCTITVKSMAVRSLGAPNLAIVLAGVCDTSVVGKQGVKALLQNATHSVRNMKIVHILGAGKSQRKARITAWIICVNRGRVLKPDRAVRPGARTCQEGGCSRRAEVIYGFCQLHKCNKGGCSKKRTSELSAFCKDHQCKVPHCIAAATAAGGYCDHFGHACSKPGCLRRSATGQKRSPLCLQHRIEDERRAAAEEALYELSTARFRYKSKTEQLQQALDHWEMEATKLREEKAESERREQETCQSHQRRDREKSEVHHFHEGQEQRARVQAERRRRRQQPQPQYRRAEQHQPPRIFQRDTPIPYPDSDAFESLSTDEEHNGYAVYPEPYAGQRHYTYADENAKDQRRMTRRRL
ncbi:hypothetical protein TruAng_002000 [Truncatella angustata]|nr:hypothetical protein TruAng_002000 [Truncatella angustata]